MQTIKFANISQKERQNVDKCCNFSHWPRKPFPFRVVRSPEDRLLLPRELVAGPLVGRGRPVDLAARRPLGPDPEAMQNDQRSGYRADAMPGDDGARAQRQQGRRTLGQPRRNLLKYLHPSNCAVSNFAAKTRGRERAAL